MCSSRLPRPTILRNGIVLDKNFVILASAACAECKKCSETQRREDVLDLRASGWEDQKKATKKNEGPMKLDDVHDGRWA